MRCVCASTPARISIHPIRCEDFLGSQEAVLRRICRFFGMEYLDSMLDVSQSSEARRIAGLSTLWESNTSAPIPANADKFKKTLSMAEIEVIETLAGELMGHYGYERLTKGRAVFSADFVRLAHERSEAKHRQAWEDLVGNNHRDYVLRQLPEERARTPDVLRRRQGPVGRARHGHSHVS